MLRPSRIRRIAKWSGVVVCVILALAWGVSLCAGVFYRRPEHRVVYFLWAGAAHVTRWTNNTTVLITDSGRIHLNSLHGWSATSAGPGATLWLPYYVKYPVPQPHLALGLPLWIPFALIAFPTAYLFYRDRRHPPGHCQKCGYDLTGNVSGACPECGRAV